MIASPYLVEDLPMISAELTRFPPVQAKKGKFSAQPTWGCLERLGARVEQFGCGVSP